MSQRHNPNNDSLLSHLQCSISHNEKEVKIGIKEASFQIIKNAIPAIIGSLCELLYQVVNLIIIGHLNDPAALGGVGLGYSLINMCCLTVCFGLNSAIDTLVSQAFGDKEFYLCGCYLNRGLIIQTLFTVPEFILLSYSKDILLAIGQDELSVNQAQMYIYVSMPGLFGFVLFETLRRYLQSMGIFKIQMYIQGATLITHTILCYCFVFIFGFGVIGAGLAITITYWLNLIILTVYIQSNPGIIPRESWHFFNADSFKNFFEYLKYGIPGALMLGALWWAYEALTLYCGWLSTDELAAYVVILNFLTLAYQFPYGMSLATCNLVGSSLGEHNPEKAKTYSKASFVCMLTLTALLISTMIIFRYEVAMIYTKDEKVVEHIVSIIPVLSIMIFFDFSQGVLGGSIRAIGYQHLGTIVCFIGYWLVMLPMCYLFAFVLDLRLLGIWLGVPLGSIIDFACISLVLICVNWNKISDQIIERIMKEKQGLIIAEECEMSNGNI